MTEYYRQGSFKKMALVHFEALDPSEAVLYAGNYQVICQNHKYPDGPELTKFLCVTLQIKKKYADI